MKDVADVMGVSVMTVSNAFNRPDQLSADLRQRVLARAEKMGYAGPNAAARHLRSGRTNTYGVIFEERLSYAFSDPFTVRWLAAFSRVMEERRANMLLLAVANGDADVRAAVQDASMDGVAGVCANVEGIRIAHEMGLPTVVTSLGGGRTCADADHVVIDDAAAGRQAAEHLRRLGHETIDVVVESNTPGTVVWEPDAFVRDHTERYGGEKLPDSWLRLSGILDGLAGARVRIICAGINTRAAGQDAASAVLDRHDRPTGVVAISDVIALGVADACADRGLEPGRDLSIVGFDDLPEAAAAGLTTIAQPIEDKGRLAAELLLDPLRTPRQIVLPHRLVVRSSTQPVRSH